MSTNNFFRSDLYSINNIIQSSMLTYPKEVIIATLRDYFSKDSFYHFSKDQWGFPNTPDLTDVPSEAGLYDNITTRLFIGENYRFSNVYYPAILVKNNGSKYVPISINRNKGVIQNENILYVDGYGNESIIAKPIAFVTSGVWEGSINIDVLTRSLRARDDLIDLIGLCFSEITVDYLYDIGIIVKPLTIGSPSETDDRNDKLFRQTITLDVRTEWQRSIPIGNIIEAISFVINFQNIENNNPPAPNIAIHSDVNITDMLINL